MCATSPSGITCPSFAITQHLPVLADGGVEFFGLGHLPVEFGGQFGHLLLERYAVVLDLLSPDVSAGREDVAVGFDLIQRGALAECRDILVLASILLTSPSVVRVGDLGDVFFGQFAVGAVDEVAHLAGIDEKRLAVAGAKAALLVNALVAGQEPEADGDRRSVEELAGQADDAIHHIGFDDCLTDVALAGGVAGERAVGQDEARCAVGRGGGGNEGSRRSWRCRRRRGRRSRPFACVRRRVRARTGRYLKTGRSAASERRP